MNENITVYQMVENIVQVVFYTYYGYVKEQTLKEDMMQQGFMKAYELLNNGNYDPTMSLRNFIFTGVRNEMHNMLYHLNKIPTVDLEQLDKYENVVGYYDTGDLTFEMKKIKEITDIFSRNGNYFPSIYNYVISLGLIQAEPIPEPEVNAKMLDSIKALVLWKLYEEEVNNG